MLVKLNVSFKPNLTVNITKSKETTPVSLPTTLPKLKFMLFKKNSRTTLSGNIQPSNSPSNVPNKVPKKSIRTIIERERLFNIIPLD